MIRVVILKKPSPYIDMVLHNLSSDPELEVTLIEETIGNIDALQLTETDVAVIDLNAGDLTRDTISSIEQLATKAKTIALAESDDDEYIYTLLKAGIVAYLLKQDAHLSITDAIKKVQNGESVIDGRVIRTVIKYFMQLKDNKLSLNGYTLSNREKEIVVLLIKGLSYKEIAANCFISVDTLNSHIRKIYRKLRVHSRSEIAARFRL